MPKWLKALPQICTSLTREKKNDPDNLASHPRTSPQRSPDLRFTPNQLQSRTVTQ